MVVSISNTVRKRLLPMAERWKIEVYADGYWESSSFQSPDNLMNLEEAIRYVYKMRSSLLYCMTQYDYHYRLRNAKEVIPVEALI